MMHLIPADYTETLDCLSRSIAKHDVILPLAALFLLIKSYASIDPHSQVCHSCQFNNTNQATTECLANSFISTL